jgi:nucleotide-binding universal stress UspA family protein
MKILVAVDGSPFTKRMLAYIAAHDEWLGAHHEYTLLHVVPALPLRVTAALSKEAVASYYADLSEEVFKPIRAFYEQQGLRAEFVARTGAPADTIAAQAEQGRFDLLMLGSHGHGALGNLVLGSVVTRVLAQCSVPLLLVR